MTQRQRSQSQNVGIPNADTVENPVSDQAPKFVIQRTSETIREWWTGDRWSDDMNHALRYSSKPDASVETLDESAKSINLEDIDD